MSQDFPKQWEGLSGSIVQKLGVAALDPDAWPDALDALGEAFSATSFTFRSIEAGAPRAVGSGDLGAILKEYAAGEWWTRDPRLPALAAAPMMTPFEDHDLLPADVIEDAEFYRDFAMANDISNLLGWRFEHDGMPFCFATLRSKDRGRATDDERRALESVMGQATHAAILSATLSRRTSACVMETLINAGKAACLIDRRGMVLEATPALEKHLGSAVSISEGILSFGSIKPKGALEALMQSLRSPDPAAASVRGFVASAPNATRLFCMPLILGCSGADLLSGARAIMIFRPLDSPVQLDAGLLTELFGLRTSEADVAILIAQGKSASEVATIRGVSIHTVRAMLKAIFQKTQVRGQAELVSLLMRTTITFGGG